MDNKHRVVLTPLERKVVSMVRNSYKKKGDNKSYLPGPRWIRVVEDPTPPLQDLQGHQWHPGELMDQLELPPL